MSKRRCRRRFGLVRSETVPLPAGGERRIDLHLPPAPPPGEAVLKGVVLDYRSCPIAGACLALLAEPGRYLVAITHSRKGGSFRLPPVAPGNYGLHVTSQGFDPRKIRLRLHRGVQQMTIRLKRHRNSASVVGWVSGSDHVPLQVPVTVVLSRDQAPRRRQRAAGDGEFAFDDLQPGSYRIIALAEGYKPAAVKFSAAAGTVLTLRLRLDPASGGATTQS